MKENKNVAFTEQEALTDVLLLQKNLVKLYASALTESANKNLRTLLQNHYKTVNADQNETFTVMQEKGYYKPKKVDKAVLDEQRENFGKILENM